MKVSPSSIAFLMALVASPTPISAFSPVAKPHRLSSITATTATTTTLHATPPPSTSNFLTPELAQSCIATASGTPLYAYSLAALSKSADACLAFPNAYGLTVRYAMKACPNGTILKYCLSRGICIDASSGYEVRLAA